MGLVWSTLLGKSQSDPLMFLLRTQVAVAARLFGDFKLNWSARQVDLCLPGRAALPLH
jgi:hypothetical protein